MKGISKSMNFVYAVTEGTYDRELVRQYNAALGRANLQATSYACKYGIDIRELLTTTFTYFSQKPSIEQVKSDIQTLNGINEMWIRKNGMTMKRIGSIFEKVQEDKTQETVESKKKWINASAIKFGCKGVYPEDVITDFINEYKAAKTRIGSFDYHHKTKLINFLFKANEFIAQKPTTEQIKSCTSQLYMIRTSWIVKNMESIITNKCFIEMPVCNNTSETLQEQKADETHQERETVETHQERETVETHQEREVVETHQTKNVVVDELESQMLELMDEIDASKDINEIKWLFKRFLKALDRRDKAKE